jgi:hypothetical protein
VDGKVAATRGRRLSGPAIAAVLALFLFAVGGVSGTAIWFAQDRTYVSPSSAPSSLRAASDTDADTEIEMIVYDASGRRRPRAPSDAPSEATPSSTGLSPDDPRATLPAALLAETPPERIAALATVRADPGSTKPIGTVMQHDPAEEVRAEALLALIWRWKNGVGGASEHERLVRWAASNTSGASRAEALLALQARGMDLDGASSLLYHASPEVRESAIGILIDIGARTAKAAEAQALLEAASEVETDKRLKRLMKKGGR